MGANLELYKGVKTEPTWRGLLVRWRSALDWNAIEGGGGWGGEEEEKEKERKRIRYTRNPTLQISLQYISKYIYGL